VPPTKTKSAINDSHLENGFTQCDLGKELIEDAIKRINVQIGLTMEDPGWI
jgi:hypothetical protein